MAAAAANVVKTSSRDSGYLDMLPARARAKMLRMIEERDELHALLRHVDGRREKAMRQLDEAEAEVSRLERANRDRLLKKEEELPQGGIRITTDETPLNEAKERAATAQADLDRMKGQYEARSEAWKHAAAINAAIEQYLRKRIPDDIEITMAEPVALKAPKMGDKLLGEIASIRSTIATLLADRRDVMMAPLPTADAKDLIKAWVADQAKKARPQVYRLLDGSSEINFPVTTRAKADLTVIMEGGKGFGIASGGVGVTDPVSFQCWIDPAAVVAALARDLAEIADDSRAITKEERELLEQEISAKILHAERTEETMVEAALAEHLEVYRRPDADPRAILGLADDLPEARA